MTLLAIIGNLILSIGLPVGLFVFLAVKKRRYIPAFLAGVLTFLVFQIFIRMPLLQQILPRFGWYNIFQATSPVLFALFISFTAGLFEETGRYIVMRFLLPKPLGTKSATVFGLAHGGIEALLLIGINYLSLLFYQPIIVWSSLSAGQVALAGMERFFSIIVHIGLSVLVSQGVNQKKILRLFVAIFLHTLLNFVSLFMVLKKIPFIIIEIFIALFAIALACFVFIPLYKKHKANSRTHTYKKEDIL